MNIAEKIRQKSKTVYQRIAKKHGVSVDYVGKIARSERKPTKKKGLEILKELEAML